MTTQASEIPSNIYKIKTIIPLDEPRESTIPKPALLDLITYKGRPIPPGVDIHLCKDEVIFFFKLSKTLLHNKQDRESEAYDEHFPTPVYPSPRKPVWLLSELIEWQEKLKSKRNRNTSRGGDNEKFQ